MNQDFLKGKWTEIKGEIQKAWGNITGDELEETKGDLKSIAGLVHQKYGIAQEESMQKLHGIVGQFDEKLEDKKEDLRNSMDQH